MPEDAELLRQYQEHRSQEAFTELVRRHVNLVYFTVLRRVGGDRHLADDVTQRVFADLARKAASLRERPVLSGWLYTSARFAAAQAVRTEQRQRTHVTAAQAMHELHATPAADWEQLRPVIDEAMEELSEPEREVVLLRFFENRPLAEVGARFSLTPDAARMRVDRALDKLRGLLVKRGITSTAVALGAIFAAQSGLAAPAGLVARIVAGSLGPGGAATVATVAAWKIAAGVAALVVGIGLVGYVAAVRLEKIPAAEAVVPTGTETSERSVAQPVALPIPPSRPASAAAPVAAPAQVELVPTPSAFAGLTPREKNMLKRLREIQKVAPDEWPAHRGFVVNPEAPGLADIKLAIEALQSVGLIEVGAAKGVIFLTRRGKAFCAAHAGEIDAYALKPNPGRLDKAAGFYGDQNQVFLRKSSP